MIRRVVHREPMVRETRPWRWAGITLGMGLGAALCFVLVERGGPAWWFVSKGILGVVLTLAAMVASGVTLLEFFPERRQMWLALATYAVGVWMVMSVMILGIAVGTRGIGVVLGARAWDVMEWMSSTLVCSLPTFSGGGMMWLMGARDWRGRPRRCPACDYDLQGTRYSALCPECGAAVRNGFNMPLSPEGEDRALDVLAKGEVGDEEGEVEEEGRGAVSRGGGEGV